MTIDFAALAAPFPADRVSWRVGSTNKDKTKGMALAYIDARDVMERLDAVCGPAGWQCRYSHTDGKTVCDLALKVGDEWIWKADGAGDTDYEAEKGALSDAFKRSAVRWGIGRYLYDLASPWVEIEPMGAKSFKVKESEKGKLTRVAGGATTAPRQEQPSEPSAIETAAIRLLTDQTEPEAFKAVWATNKDGWKENFEPAAYARIVAVMKQKAEVFQRRAAAMNTDPFSEAA